MKSKDIRQAFFDYFEKEGHTRVASSPLIPQGDDTLLFANAGMNQFKNTFTGLEERPYTRAVSSQKCVRAGGKHNDLENVGHTARHHTFFEMLGNFSFGDYFKEEAIRFAWDFLTRVLNIDKDRLYVTVHISDDEAATIWEKQEGVPAERILRFDEDNFWRMGDVGPCGPSSEIFFDHAPDGRLPSAEDFEAQGDRFVEIWNLVFMQFVEDENGRQPLPKPSVDTGSGLERLTAALQGQANNYDTDVFAPLLEKVSQLSGLPYDSRGGKEETLSAMRVLADHARATAFLVADGVLPSNEGRGYVLRRILRRAIRYGRKLSPTASFLPALTEVVVDSMGGTYPELRQKKTLIFSTAKDEEERFLHTLDQGTQILSAELKKMDSKVVPGAVVFKLYDTYGFPSDLTRLMAAEQGFEIDEKAFEEEMEEARQRARSSWKGKGVQADEAHLLQVAQNQPATRFTGYTSTTGQGRILFSESGLVVLDETCFYAEGGGQVGDTGELKTETGHASVVNCTKVGEVFFHHVEGVTGELRSGQSADLTVTESLRRDTAANHSATHLLHSALREILGDHVTQAGSLVDAQRLRFDFTHNKALSSDELNLLEEWVNREIAAAYDSATVVTDPKTAMEKEGALALFGEKYGDQVRVVKMGPHSAELCGGTHVANTAMIRAFQIVSEAGVSAGIRRIEALTGSHAIRFLQKHAGENLLARSKAGLQVPWSKFMEDSQQVADEIDRLGAEVKQLRKELFAAQGSQIDLDQLLSQGKEFSSESEKGRLVTAELQTDDRKMLSDVTDKLKSKVQSGVVITLGKGEKSHPIIVAVTKNLIPEVNAGKLLKDVASVMGGKGGGRPDFAQGAVQDLGKTSEGFKKAENLLGLS